MNKEPNTKMVCELCEHCVTATANGRTHCAKGRFGWGTEHIAEKRFYRTECKHFKRREERETMITLPCPICNRQPNQLDATVEVIICCCCPHQARGKTVVEAVDAWNQLPEIVSAACKRDMDNRG